MRPCTALGAFLPVSICAAVGQAQAQEEHRFSLVLTGEIIAGDGDASWLDHSALGFDAPIGANTVLNTHIHALFVNTSGDAPNNGQGTLQGVSNIEVSRPRGRLQEFWIEHTWPTADAALLGGLFDLNSEFYVTPAAGDFIHPSFGIGPELAAVGENGPSVFPSTALALRLRARIIEELNFLVAAINADARTIGDPGGVDVGFDDGLLLIAELQHGGVIDVRAGVWSLTERQTRYDVAFAEDASARGGYLLVQTPVFSTEAQAFVRLGVSDGDTSPFQASWQAGVTMPAPTPSERNARLGLGAAGVSLSRGGRNVIEAGNGVPARDETAWELYLVNEFSDNLSVQVSIQAIDHPGAHGSAPTQWLSGLRLRLTL